MKKDIDLFALTCLKNSFIKGKSEVVFGLGLYDKEEELKRLRAAIAGDSAYCEIGFSYDNEVEKFSEPEGPKEEPEELYEAPSGLDVPKGMEVPYNMKIHAIIERTAMFVSEQGGQMEIIIKMKQQNNPQFGFMHLDNPLYPYYKFLLKEIKSGAYKPVPPRRVSRSEDEDEDGHYLHPSLLAGKKENVPKFTVPSINFRRSQDDSYSVLVRNLQQQLVEEKLAREKESVPETLQQRLVNYSIDESMLNDSLNNSQTVQVVPPPDIQPIIQKMAEYVAKNGEDFEYVVKSKKDKRFEFLQPTCEFYSYYIHLRDSAKLQLQPSSAAKGDSATLFGEKSSTSENLLANAVQLDSLNHPEGHEDVSTMDEFDALYAQNSQDIMFRPEGATEDHSNSADSFDSLGLPRESKSKNLKVPKGPISFSLRAKEPDTVPTEKTKIPLLLDDSDEENGAEGGEKSEPRRKRRKSTEERSAPTSRHHSVEREEKPKLSSEMEAKLAEERMKDKLLSAARERMVQQKREKRLEQERQKREEQLKKEKQLHVEQQRKERQLQMERKKKAALFLKMLKSRNPELNIEDQQKKAEKSDFWNLAADAAGEENGILFPLPKLANLSRRRSSNLAIPGIKSDWSGSSASEESGEEIMITEFCSDPDPPQLPNSAAAVPAPPEKGSPEPQRKHEHKRKRKKRSKSRDRHRRSSRSRRSRSPRNSSHKNERTKKEKEKKLPAAYALVKRSRSRSRSPRRYRQNPYWNRRR